MSSTVRKTMYTRELCQRAGITRDTLRYWRARGLLTPTRNQKNNYLMYADDDVERARFIRDAQRLGFTLTEIRTLLDAMRGASCRHQALLPHLKRHDESLREKIRTLRRMQRRIAQLIAEYRSTDCRVQPRDLHL